MHQLVLITAMTATTGLFGGGKHCGKPHHGKKAVAASSCYSASPCGASYAHGGPTAPAPYAAPSMQSYAPAPQAVPSAPAAPAKMAPPAPPAPTPSSAYLDPDGSLPIVSTGGLR